MHKNYMKNIRSFSPFQIHRYVVTIRSITKYITSLSPLFTIKRNLKEGSTSIPCALATSGPEYSHSSKYSQSQLAMFRLPLAVSPTSSCYIPTSGCIPNYVWLHSLPPVATFRTIAWLYTGPQREGRQRQLIRFRGHIRNNLKKGKTEKEVVTQYTYFFNYFIKGQKYCAIYVTRSCHVFYPIEDPIKSQK